MLAASGREHRRERTFIGSKCAACEEPLEHILRGERILQLSCGHFAHEACLQEYIQEFEAQTCPACDAPITFDTSRGGNYDALNKLVRSAQTSSRRNDRARDLETTPVPWETDTIREQHSVHHHHQRSQTPSSRDALMPQPRAPTPSSRDALMSEPYPRNGVNGSRRDFHDGRQSDAPPHALPPHALTSPSEYTGSARRHDYDVQSMETALSSPRHTARNPIPPPLVTIRSEFPTITKSRNQQSLTCLVTVEVVEGKWQPNPDDFRSPPPMPSLDSEVTNGFRELITRKPVASAGSERPVDSVHGSSTELQEVKDALFKRVDNWHGLDFQRFGKLILHGMVRVGKDRQTWQDLECYLFTDMLICVKEKKANANQQWDAAEGPRPWTRFTLKGSILIKKHLKHVEMVPGFEILTLSLSVAELPAFHLRFQDRATLDTWRRALLGITRKDLPPIPQQAEFDPDTSATDDDDYPPSRSKTDKRVSSVRSSSQGAPRSHATAPTEYTNSRSGLQDYPRAPPLFHVPLDMVVVIPVSPAMQGLKLNLLADSLRFLVANLGERDRMGLVTFGSAGGAVPLVSMANKHWPGWTDVLTSIRPAGSKSVRADVAEGANVAMDLLMQRKSSNPLSQILLVSDSAASDPDTVDFVVSRAEAAKIGIHAFGLGLNHRPDTLVELSTRTKASYTFVKDWMMLRECLAGCLGSLQSISHQNVKLKLRLPEGSPAKLVKVGGALQVTKRATGRDAEASLGDLRFGDKRDILVQLAIQADSSTPDSVPSDPWENIISNLEALGPLEHEGSSRGASVEELPLIQADLGWGDILREGHLTHLPRPSLLAITMLPSKGKRAPYSRPATPPIPPHPSVVQRRMELLTSDMLSRALNLVVRGQNDRANHLLIETRTILKGLAKGGLPPLPTPPPTAALPPTPRTLEPKHYSSSDALDMASPTTTTTTDGGSNSSLHQHHHPAIPSRNASPHSFHASAGIDPATIIALDADLDASLEWILHPTVFGRDSRKAVLQAIGVISSQRGYTFRTPTESLWAARIPGVRRLADRSQEWREAGEELHPHQQRATLPEEEEEGGEGEESASRG